MSWLWERETSMLCAAPDTAGTECFIPLPVRSFRLQLVFLQLTTSATVSNRYPILDLYIGSVMVARIPSSQVVAASDTRFITWGAVTAAYTVSNVGAANNVPLLPFDLPAESRLRVWNTGGIATDLMSARALITLR